MSWTEKVVVDATGIEAIIARVGVSETPAAVSGIEVPPSSDYVASALALAKFRAGLGQVSEGKEVLAIQACAGTPLASFTTTIPTLVLTDTKVEEVPTGPEAGPKATVSEGVATKIPPWRRAMSLDD